MSKMSEYSTGRDDGLLKALQIVRDGGKEALEKEIRFRGITGIHTSYSNKELDKITEKIKQVIFETVTIACVSVLHDEFGFGEKRCQRFMDAFGKLDAYLVHGWLYWTDLIENIKQEIGIEMAHKYMLMGDMGGRYCHPDPEDIYTEDDLIADGQWEQILKQLRFTEKESPTEKGRYEIYDSEGVPCLSYRGEYNKISVFDVLSGILIAKEHWGIGDESAGTKTG